MAGLSQAEHGDFTKLGRQRQKFGKLKQLKIMASSLLSTFMRVNLAEVAPPHHGS